MTDDADDGDDGEEDGERSPGPGVLPVPDVIASGEFARWSWERRLETIRRMFDEAAARLVGGQDGEAPGEG